MKFLDKNYERIKKITLSSSRIILLKKRFITNNYFKTRELVLNII